MAMKKNEQAIGILDSGVGGLTVAREVMRQLPREKIIYVGDTLRCPYGPRPVDEVRRFTMEIIQFLRQFSLKAILIACNTATAVALEDVRNFLSIPVLGVIEPGARAAIKVTQTNRIGVIGTQGTIQSHAYEKALYRIHPQLTVFSLACPPFVPLVERGERTGALVEKVVSETLQPLKDTHIDTLILGCTHYPLLFDPISKVMGEHVSIISSAEETAAELSTILQHQDLLSTNENPVHCFYTTGLKAPFARIAEDWFGHSVPVQTIALKPLGKIS